MTSLDPPVLHTTVGDMPLEEVQLAVNGREWTILHTGAVISRADELAFLRSETTTKRPYGVVLWPAAIALAHEVATRQITGVRILELGAGTGLPGIVAASLGARVVQTLGSDILYAESLHPHLRHIFETNLAPNGAVLIADPFRESSLQFLEAMQADGWRVTLDKWTVGLAPPPRPVGVFTLTPMSRSRQV